MKKIINLKFINYLSKKVFDTATPTRTNFELGTLKNSTEKQGVCLCLCVGRERKGGELSLGKVWRSQEARESYNFENFWEREGEKKRGCKSGEKLRLKNISEFALPLEHGESGKKKRERGKS